MREITLVQLNDLHGYMEPHPEWMWSAEGFTYRQMGGLARIKSVVDQLRQSYPYLLFTDNGDTLHGTRPVVESKGRCLVPILNQLGLSAMTGHWDFAYGPDHLQQLAGELNYPFLAANVYACEDGRSIFPAVCKLDCGPVRVGIIGLACNIVDKVMPPHFSTGIRFTTGEEELSGYIEQLREKEHCDVVVLLSHLGLPQDIALLERVPGVDVCLSGHTHNRIRSPIYVGRTVVIQSGCHGSFLGMLRLGVDESGVTVQEHRLIPIDEQVTEEPKIAALVRSALSSMQEDEQIVGSTEVDLNRATMLEASADNLLLEAMRSATGAEIAFLNGWRYGAPIPKGPVTVNALYNLAPMNPEITQVDLRGDEIWQMMEENLERTFSRNPFGQMGGYVKRCGGMKIFFKAENPSGTRLQAIFIGDKALDPERVYQAAFITMQAVPEKYGSNRRDSGLRLIEAATHLLSQAPFRADLHASVVEV